MGTKLKRNIERQLYLVFKNTLSNPTFAGSITKCPKRHFSIGTDYGITGRNCRLTECGQIHII